ncbi:MAG: S41 family peptidase, partial [Alphaproteobacteria bacterium]
MRYAISAAFVAILLLVGTGGPRAQSQDNPDTYQLLSLFGDVFERIRTQYVEDISDEELIEAAISGMLTSLDPHSGYMDPETFRDMQVDTRGEFGGLGIQVQMEDGLVRVVSPMRGTPAEAVGIEPNDLITHIDGAPVRGLTLEDAVDLMRGPVGSDIVLTVVREGTEPFDVTITRAIITVPSTSHRLFGDVGYIAINSFTDQTVPGVEAAMRQFQREAGDELAGIVLDLRRNPGGLLDQAVGVSDAFLEQGEIVSTRQRDPADGVRFNASPGDLSGGLPLVVLIDGGSASASEIVAGALQDHRRAVIMGTTSFGKGSVQSIMPLSNDGAMRLTTAKYYTPSGR